MASSRQTSSARKRTTTPQRSTAVKSTGANRTRTSSTSTRPRQTSGKRRKKKIKSVAFNEAALFAVLAVALILFLSNFGIAGKFGKFFAALQFGTFGLLAYLFPIALVFGTIIMLSKARNSGVLRVKFITGFVGALFFCAFMEMISGGYAKYEKFSEYYNFVAPVKKGGGIVGGAMCAFLTTAVGKVGAYIVIVMFIIITIVIISERSIIKGLTNGSKKVIKTAKYDIDEYREESEKKRAIRQEQKEIKEQQNKAKEQQRIKERQNEEREQRRRFDQKVSGVDLSIEIPRENRRTDILGSKTQEPANDVQGEAVPSSEVVAGADVRELFQSDKYSENIIEIEPQNAVNRSVSSVKSQRSRNNKNEEKEEIKNTNNSLYDGLFSRKQNEPEVTDYSAASRIIFESSVKPERAAKPFVETEPERVVKPSAISENIAKPTMSLENTAGVSALSESTVKPLVEDEPERVAKSSAIFESVSEISNEPERVIEPEQVSEISSEPESTVEPAVFSESASRISTEPERIEEPFAEVEPERVAEPFTISDSVSEISSEPKHIAEPSVIPERVSEISVEPEHTVDPYEQLQELPEDDSMEQWQRQEELAKKSALEDVRKEDAKKTPEDDDLIWYESEPSNLPAKEKNATSQSTVSKKNSEPEKTDEQVDAEISEELRQSEELNEEIKEKPYQFPPVELLHKGSSSNTTSPDELRETAMKLQRTLSNFGVRVTVADVSCGPAVTRYEIQPEQGVKVSKIVSLADDIKLNLAASDIRIEAPIPGKAAVGIEVPNKEISGVTLREIIESRQFAESESPIAFGVGKDIAGQVVVADIAKMPHVLIAGATGSGKSVCINTIIMSILYKAKPSEVKLIMVDPKVVELSIYNGIPHLMIPVVTDSKKAAGALNWAVAEMDDRYKKFAQAGVRDLKGYNAKVEKLKDVEMENKPVKLPQIVIIIDELADLMMIAKNEVEDAIVRLAQLARAAGIHLVIATQRPSVDVITGLIKANIPSRIAFAVSSGVDSRTILDMVGAEKLLGRGDMLFSPAGYPKPARVQGAFVSDDEVSDVVEFLKANCGDAGGYHDEIAQRINNPAFAESQAFGNDYDEYFADAGRYLIGKGKGSVSVLQRVYRIGFNRAARIMDQLEEAGVMGPEEGTKPRKVLMTMEEFEEFLKKL